MNRLSRFSQYLGVLIPIVLLTACGGGGGGGGDRPAATAPTPPPAALAPDTGTVGIIITDADTDDFSEILATITSIELLGGNGSATIFSGSESIDFLKLSSFTELFAVADGVPAGDYSKIRLRLSDLTLVRMDDQGNVVETTNVALPGNGKIDLNPGQTFFVMPGATLLLELDLDAKKSIQIVSTGNGVRYKFRPVVFVDIHEGAQPGRLARVHGSVDSIGPAGGEFVLCQSDFVADADDEDSDGGDDNRCLTVVAADDTGIFGTDGEPVDFAALMVGDALTAIGNLRVSSESVGSAGSSSRSNSDEDSDDDSDSDDGSDDDGDSDADSDGDSDDDSDNDSDGDSDSDSDANFDDDDLILGAVVIEVGALGTFERLLATVTSDLAPDTQTFALTIAPGQGFGDDSAAAGRLQPGGRLFDRDGTPLDASALTAGATGHFEGTLLLSDADPAVFRTVLVVLDTEIANGATLSGVIQTLDTDSFTLSTDVGDRCVNVPAAAQITLVTITDDGTTSETVMLADLMSGMTADVFGREDIGGCFVAETVRAEVDASTGGNRVPLAEAGPNQSVVTGATVMLDGSMSIDPDGDALSFAWSLSAPPDSGATLSDATSASPAFVADVDGAYQAQLVVNDGTVDSLPDSVTVTAVSEVVLDGAALYADSCAGCHGSLNNSNVGNASAQSIQNAINNNVGGMGGLVTLTSDEVAAIAAALAGQ